MKWREKDREIQKWRLLPTREVEKSLRHAVVLTYKQTTGSCEGGRSYTLFHKISI